MPSPPLASLYTPHDSSHAVWQRKQYAYAPLSSKENGTPTLRRLMGTEFLLHQVKFHHTTEVIFCFLTSLHIDPHLIVTQWKHRLQNNQ
jgi:hypothetical protein